MVAEIINFLEHFYSHSTGAVKLLSDCFSDYKCKFVFESNCANREKTVYTNE